MAAASLWFPTILASSRDRKDEDESKARTWRFVVLVFKVRKEGARHGGLESGRLEFHNGKLGFYLALHRTPDSRAQKNSIGSTLAICCRMVMKKTDLRLGSKLQEFVKSGCALGFEREF